MCWLKSFYSHSLVQLFPSYFPSVSFSFRDTFILHYILHLRPCSSPHPPSLPFRVPLMLFLFPLHPLSQPALLLDSPSFLTSSFSSFLVTLFCPFHHILSISFSLTLPSLAFLPHLSVVSSFPMK